MTEHTFPRFDPDSPDQLILAAFETVRAARQFIFSFDHLPDDQSPLGDISGAEFRSIEAEDQVHGNFATTPAGIMARLALVLVSSDQNRWVDNALMTHGFGALYQRRDDLDGNTRQIMQAAIELLHLDWETALADYQRSAVDFDLALKVKSAAEDEHFRLRGADTEDPPFLTNLLALAQQLEDRFENNRQIRRLLRTLPPSHEALSLKLQILATEGETDNVTQWIARDVDFLAGLTVNIDEGEK